MNAQEIAAADLDVVAEIRICVRRNGAMSVEGPIDDVAWCLQVLEQAKDSVAHHKYHRGELVIPGRDLATPARQNRSG